MSREFGWTDSAQRYLAIYRKLAPNAAAPEIEINQISAAPVPQLVAKARARRARKVPLAHHDTLDEVGIAATLRA